MIAEAHPLYRLAFAEALQRDPEFDVISAVEDGWTALDKARALRPDVLVADADLPGLDGPAMATRLIRGDPGARVLISAGDAGAESVERCFASGAIGLLLRDSTTTEIKQAINDAHEGIIVRPRVTGTVFDDSSSLRTAIEDYSERELAVLGYVSRGLSPEQIAGVMFLTPAVVKDQLRAIYGRLGASERSGAVGEAMRRKLFE